MNNIKNAIKKNKFIYNCLSGVRDNYCKLLTVISPTLNTKVCYKIAFKKKLDLKNPKTFNEKILWLKLNNYNKNPLVYKCVDKVAVKEYLKEKGLDKYVIPTLGVYNKPKDIDWSVLPDKFVIKLNFGCGMNIICTDKSKLDIKKTNKQLKKWLKNKQWLRWSEMQYKYCPKQIFIEEYIAPETGKQPDDYKFYCFKGNVDSVMVCQGREFGLPKFYYYNKDWKLLPNSKDSIKILQSNSDSPVMKPLKCDEMFDIASKLSEDFPFVRVDLYYEDNKIYFGELTFTPAGGLGSTKLQSLEKYMGELIVLEEYK